MVWVSSNQKQAKFYYAYIHNQTEFVEGKNCGNIGKLQRNFRYSIFVADTLLCVILFCDYLIFLYVLIDFRKIQSLTSSGINSLDPEDRDSKFLRKATMPCQTQKPTKCQQL